jgi:hypothetical protein
MLRLTCLRRLMNRLTLGGLAQTYQGYNKVQMPFEIILAQRPAGYAAEAAKGVEGHPLRVITREFTSSEDGDKFISRLEGFPSTVVAQLPATAGIRPSQIDHLFVVIKDDLSATVYVNELPIAASVRAKRSVIAGEEVTIDDIADFQRVEFGVVVPVDAAVMVVMSAGWRKGLFFDFGPINGKGNRAYDLDQLLTAHFAYLHNQAVFALTEDDWTYLIDQLWCPFVALPRQIVDTLVGRARSREPLDIMVPKVRVAVADRLPAFIESWSKGAEFKPHLELLSHAADEFNEGDYVSAPAILYPRIEGILREAHAAPEARQRVSQASLAENIVTASGERPPHSWLLTAMFERYLREAYFANFEPGKPAKLSRNSVGHGVVAAEQFNEKAAAIGFLVIEQIHWFLPKEPA